MREIKFRGWHTVDKKMFSAEEMAADQLTLLTTGSFINVSGDSTRLSVIYPQDKFIPLQYIGLKDLNGIEIYEGDIVQWWNKLSKPEVVEATNGGWNPFIDSCTTDHSYHYIVIGNIYKNSELKGDSR